VAFYFVSNLAVLIVGILEPASLIIKRHSYLYYTSQTRVYEK